jgi:hypothetical protein
VKLKFTELSINFQQTLFHQQRRPSQVGYLLESVRPAKQIAVFPPAG